MNNQSEVIRNDKSFVFNTISWLVGLLFFTIGLINMFWGNDFFFGVFLAGLSLVFLPPVNVFARDKFGFSIPLVAKIIIGLFIIWSAVGVGELFDKIDMLVRDLK